MTYINITGAGSANNPFAPTYEASNKRTKNYPTLLTDPQSGQPVQPAPIYVKAAEAAKIQKELLKHNTKVDVETPGSLKQKWRAMGDEELGPEG